jgi:hypothetical protein
MPSDLAIGPLSPRPSKAERERTLNLPRHATAVCLNLAENVPFEEWRDIGRKLGRARSSVQWLIADWWVYGEHRYGAPISAGREPGLKLRDMHEL